MEMHGDDVAGIRCPHCKHLNKKVSYGQVLIAGQSISFKVACGRCKKTVFYKGPCTLPLQAFVEDPSLSALGTGT